MGEEGFASTSMCEISTEMLRNVDSRFDLYARYGTDVALRLYRGREHPLDERAFNWLKEHRISTLFISSSDFEAYKCEVSNKVLDDGELPANQRLKVLKETRQQTFDETFRAEGVAAHDPLADLPRPRRGRRVPRVLSREEVEPSNVGDGRGLGSEGFGTLLVFAAREAGKPLFS